MNHATSASLPVVNKTYKVHYKNQYDQAGHMTAELIHSNLDGFLVFKVTDHMVMIPKERVFILQEVINEKSSDDKGIDASTKEHSNNDPK